MMPFSLPLHTHKDQTDKINLLEIAEDFAPFNKRRAGPYAAWGASEPLVKCKFAISMNSSILHVHTYSFSPTERAEHRLFPFPVGGPGTL